MRERSGEIVENVAVLNRVIAHEKFAGVLFVVEVVGQIAHKPVEVVELVDDVFGEVFLRFELALIAFLETAEAVYVVAADVGVHCIGIEAVAQFEVFLQQVPLFLDKEVVAVETLGQTFPVLRVQFGVRLVGVDSLAEVDELLEVVEGSEVYPEAAEIAVVVLGPCAAVDRGIAVAV